MVGIRYNWELLGPMASPTNCTARPDVAIVSVSRLRLMAVTPITDTYPCGAPPMNAIPIEAGSYQFTAYALDNLGTLIAEQGPQFFQYDLSTCDSVTGSLCIRSVNFPILLP